MNTPDLFDLQKLDPEQLAKAKKNLRGHKAGASGCYAAPPGTGPQGETCGTCAHHVVRRFSKDYHKCILVRACWTHSERTDIRVRSPACAKWKKEE